MQGGVHERYRGLEVGREVPESSCTVKIVNLEWTYVDIWYSRIYHAFPLGSKATNNVNPLLQEESQRNFLSMVPNLWSGRIEIYIYIIKKHIYHIEYIWILYDINNKYIYIRIIKYIPNKNTHTHLYNPHWFEELCRSYITPIHFFKNNGFSTCRRSSAS